MKPIPVCIILSTDHPGGRFYFYFKGLLDIHPYIHYVEKLGGVDRKGQKMTRDEIKDKFLGRKSYLPSSLRI